MALRVGDVFAGFEIEGELGRGGWGVVYAVRHPRMKRVVALKILQGDLVADREAHAAFDREAELAASLDHPNIVPVYDRSAADDPLLWLVMRYIPGGDVAGLLRRNPGGIAPPLAVDLITDAAAALDYAHRQGVLHRDVKPANLMLENDPRNGLRALLTDFGIARAVNSTATLRSPLGTLAYTAPERFSGAVVDHRTDIYSLGATLYHLLTGRHPFPYADSVALMGAHLTEPPPAPGRIRPELPRQLDTVIAVALAKDPAGRYATCTALAHATRDALRALPPSAPARPSASAPSPTLARRLAPTEVRHPLATAHRVPEQAPRERPVVAPPQGRSGSSAAAPVPESPPVPETPPKRRRRRKPPEPAVGQSSRAVPPPAPEPAPPSTAPEYSAGTDFDVLTGHNGPVFAVVFSPNGKVLATASEGRKVRLWNAHSRFPIGRPLTGDPFRATATAFSPGGSLLATAGFSLGDAEPKVLLWNPWSREPVDPPLVGAADERFVALAFSPGGALLLATAGFAQEESVPRVRLWDVRTRRAVGGPLIGHTDAVSTVAFSPDGAVLATAGADATARLWDVGTRRAVGGPLLGHTGAVSAVAFSPDGELLATAGEDGTARLWDVRTRAAVGRPLTGHTDAVSAVAFSPDGELLATAARDATARLWDVRTRAAVGRPLTGHTDAVSSVAFGPDGELLATAGHDRKVRLWKLAEVRRGWRESAAAASGE
ncbi:WD40 repeat domain-containing serine/threonine protein kinase [Nocardia sp. NPDC057227]|uniref:WD40 repeat domain-containing serine/threonine protein kinase n=1 Tax=Nocardia sp. NPDC057227 TaxID=3346056 RepID=UPI003639A3E9